MGTRIKGTAVLKVDYYTEEDLDDLSAEKAFNAGLDEVLANNVEYGTADYDQNHEYHVEEE